MNLYSQYEDVTDEAWRGRSCGPVALLMLMGLLRGNMVATPDEIIEKGLEVEAYKPGVGWYHKGLVRIAEKYGFSGENFDWSTHTKDEALRLLQTVANTHPFLASIITPQGGHIIVVEHIDKEKAYIYDPAYSKQEVKRTISKNDFLNAWTQRIIVIHNPS